MKNSKTVGMTNDRNSKKWSVRGDRVWILRILMSTTLILVALSLGLVSYFGLSNAERDFAVQQFDSVADNALQGVQDSFDRMKDSLISVTTLYSANAPNETTWPYVVLPGFEEMGSHLIKTSYLDSVIYTPIVRPEAGSDPRNQTSFEKFAQSYHSSEPTYPTNVGVPIPGYGFGGIWSVSDSGQFYHDVSGEVHWGNTSVDNLLMPMVQAVLGGSVTPFHINHNLNSRIEFGVAFDHIAKCVTEAGLDYDSALSDCVISTQPALTLRGEVAGDYAAPIILKGYANKLVGFVGGHFEWQNLFSHIVPAHEGDMDVVVTARTEGVDGTLSESYTFTIAITSGVASLAGIGDLHDSHNSEYGKHTKDYVVLNNILDISFYPRSSFFDEYETHTPLYVSIGSVCLILLCCCVFGLYDYSVSRASVHQQIALDTKRRFVRFISHEVRTPLNTVRLGLKLFELELNKMKQNIDRHQQPMELIRDEMRKSIVSWIDLTNDVLGNSEAAVDVLSDLLNYDKIETGTLRLEFSVVAIFIVVGDVFKAFGLQAQQKSINLTLTGSLWDQAAAAAKTAVGQTREVGNSNDPHQQHEQHEQQRQQRRRVLRTGVLGDATRIAQVLRNLLSNALKFTPEHGSVVMRADWVENGLPASEVTIDVPADQAGEATLTLLEEPRAGSIRISVTDSGAGLSQDQLAQICTEGVQFNANQLQAGQGSGLGLFISKGIVEQHGGRMTVTSEGLGKGATFTIEFPLFSLPESVNLYDEVSDSTRAKNEDKVATLEATPLHVLVVDDAASNRKLLMRILRSKGYRCEEAEDGAKGVAKYQEMCADGFPPDAILSDYEMPVMIGPHAVLKMRQMGCESFIVGITGNVMQSDIDFFKEHGADAVLAKPLNTDTFESLFKQHRTRRVVSSRDNHSAREMKHSVSSGRSVIPGMEPTKVVPLNNEQI